MRRQDRDAPGMRHAAGGKLGLSTVGIDADHEAIEDGCISITPIHLDSTHYGALEQFRPWETMVKQGIRRSAIMRSIRVGAEELET